MKKNSLKIQIFIFVLISILSLHSNFTNAQLKVEDNGYVGVNTVTAPNTLQIGDKMAFISKSSTKWLGYNISNYAYTRLSYGKASAIKFGSDGEIAFASTNINGNAGSDINWTWNMIISPNNNDVWFGRNINCNRLYERSPSSSANKEAKPMSGSIVKLIKLEESVVKEEGNTFGIINVDGLENLFPEAVKTDENGNKSVSYIRLIPYLVSGIKEQQEVINSLESKVELLQNTIHVENSAANFGETKLYQNNPNPFSENTEIEVNIDVSINDATLFIYDMQGKQIKSIAINQKGESSITIFGSEFEAGMYYYALIVDGKEIDTKKMILTK